MSTPVYDLSDLKIPGHHSDDLLPGPLHLLKGGNGDCGFPGLHRCSSERITLLPGAVVDGVLIGGSRRYHWNGSSVNTSRRLISPETTTNRYFGRRPARP